MSSIALVMIARDESRCIERCLASAAPWVDEMIVLDTGSTDDTPRRAARAGATVFSFTWVDDFAVARNAALERAQSDWVLVLDADEWLGDGAQALRALRDERERFIGVVSVNNVFGADAASACASVSWIARILPRGVRYAGRIHEQPQSTLPRRRVALTIEHDGYLDAPMRAKRGRNERLLRLALVEAPEDAYLHYQLAKDLELQGDFAAALPHYQRAVADVDDAATWRHDLVLRALFTLKKCKRFGQALALAQAEMPRWPHSPDFYFALGDLALDWAAHDPSRCAELVPMIESSWMRAIEIGETRDVPDRVLGRGSFLAAHNLAVLYDGLHLADQALHWRQRAQAMRSAANER